MPSRQRKKILKISCAILFVLTTSCARVSIRDGEWCGDVGAQGAWCFHTLSDKERDVPKDQWDAERVGQICGDADTFVNWKEAILKLCNETKHCTWEDLQTLENFQANVETVAHKSESEKVLK